MMKVKAIKIFLLFLTVCSFAKAQNGSIGIGTETPNPNAVLELVSPDNNQGLLVPRLSTEQRNDSTFVNSLDSLDNGLLVFDSDENVFYFWEEDQWRGFTATGGGPGELTFDDQTFELSITGGNTVTLSVFVDEYDSDSTNELQTLTFLNDTLFLSDGGGFAKIDTSSINEIQDLDLTGSTLTITNNASATPIDLSPFTGTNTDEQTLSYEESTNTLSISNGNSVDLTDLTDLNDADSTNEIQDLQLSSDILTITNNSSPTSIDLSPYADDQNLDLTGNTLSIDDGNNVDLTDIASKWTQTGATISYSAGNVRMDQGLITTPASSIIIIPDSASTLTTSDILTTVIYVQAGTSNVGVHRIAAGSDGQHLIIIGTTSTAVTFRDNNETGYTGTDRLTLDGVDPLVREGDVLTLIYSSRIGSWVQVSFQDNQYDYE